MKKALLREGFSASGKKFYYYVQPMQLFLVF